MPLDLAKTAYFSVRLGLKILSNCSRNNVVDVTDMPFPVYVWHIIKNSSRAERLSCLAALLALLVCVGLIVFFTVLAKNTTDDITDVGKFYIHFFLSLLSLFVE